MAPNLTEPHVGLSTSSPSTLTRSDGVTLTNLDMDFAASRPAAAALHHDSRALHKGTGPLSV